MQRRDALKQLALLSAGLTVTPSLLANVAVKVATGGMPADVSAERLDLLAELAETIIPTTDTPGAKAAGAHRFIALALEDCVKKEERDQFWTWLDALEADCKQQYSKSFTALNTAQRNEFLTRTEAAAAKATKEQPSSWPALKALTLEGYFTSEIGMTQALAYDPIPGEWIPDLKIDENTKAWASYF
jgi:Gluconate 2-dehydrogenase subunit 3